MITVSPPPPPAAEGRLTLYPPRGFERALAVHRPPFRRPPRLPPVDPGDEPRRIRTARASCYGDFLGPKAADHIFGHFCPATCRPQKSSEKPF